MDSIESGSFKSLKQPFVLKNKENLELFHVDFKAKVLCFKLLRALLFSPKPFRTPEAIKERTNEKRVVFALPTGAKNTMY